MSFTRPLLICGIAATVLYIGMDVAASALLYPGYDYSAQQISELSAIGAPSRPVWIVLTWPYVLLTLAFAVGVWLTARGRLSLRLAAVLIAGSAINSLVWALFAPMHMRGTEFTGTDGAHITLAFSAVALILGMIGSGAAALGRSFRIFSVITVVAMMTAGAVVSTQVNAIAAGLPTPWMGLVERVSVYGSMIWLAVFAIALLRRERS